jgi:DNA-binding MarR family transcriptional regulator
MRLKRPAAKGSAANRNHARASRGLVLDRRTSITFFVIAIANKIVSSASQSYMQHFHIGIMEWRVMALLAAESGITAKDITVLSGVTAGSVSRAIQSLRKRGHVQASDDHTDNRRSLLVLTRAGRALHDRVIRSSLSREQLLLTGFSADEYRALLRFLERLNANVAGVSAHRPEG